jgi:5-methylcytosine-specific restriction endonuclease McrA
MTVRIPPPLVNISAWRYTAEMRQKSSKPEPDRWRRGHCQRLWSEQAGKCFYCSEPLPEPASERIRHRKREMSATIDHVLPRSLGGAAEWHNEVAACRRCNSAKADRPPTPEELCRLQILKSPL